MKVLPVPGWRPMMQLAARLHFLRCGVLLDDWSVEGTLSLRVNDISRIHWSQHLLKHNQSRLADHAASIMPMGLPSQTATAAHIVFENGVMTCLPQLFYCKLFSILKQALVTCFILDGEQC
ncbi:hypothetical protein TNCV_2541301 [Trichonephila clavipes]|nr:hypothetical protein TNCV_2541301 [Trichonephila clavipes]